jgi:hypothetical protein
MVSLHERQAGHGDGLLKFRFANGTKEPILLREAELEQPDYAQGFVATALQDTRVLKAQARRGLRRRPVERAKDFSYEIIRPPFNPACQSDRLLWRYRLRWIGVALIAARTEKRRITWIKRGLVVLSVKRTALLPANRLSSPNVRLAIVLANSSSFNRPS